MFAKSRKSISPCLSPVAKIILPSKNLPENFSAFSRLVHEVYPEAPPNGIISFDKVLEEIDVRRNSGFLDFLDTLFPHIKKSIKIIEKELRLLIEMPDQCQQLIPWLAPYFQLTQDIPVFVVIRNDSENHNRN